jgi:Aspartokinases
MEIYRFGGSSIGSIEKMRNVVNLIGDNIPKVVVLSATSETVISLEKISAYFFNREIEKAHDAITRLEFKFIDFLNNLLNNDDIKRRAVSYVLDRFRVIWNFTKGAFVPMEERRIVAQGELISTALFSFYLEEQGLKNSFLYSTDFLKTGIDRNLDMSYLKTRLKDIFFAQKDTSIFITQGDICINAYDRIDNLKHKESSYSALSIGNAIEADEIKIWKDIDSTCAYNINPTK